MKFFNKVPALLLFGIAAVIALPATASAASTFQASNVHDFNNGDEWPGAGTLIRKSGEARGKGQNGNGPAGHGSVHVRMTMSELDTNAAYSAWFIIFDEGNPCIGAENCGPADIDAVINAGGFVTGDDGTGYFVGELDEGPMPAGIPGMPGSRLNSSFGAEIHVLIQAHGDIVAGSVWGQISIPGFECTPVCEDQLGIQFLPMWP